MALRRAAYHRVVSDRFSYIWVPYRHTAFVSLRSLALVHGRVAYRLVIQQLTRRLSDLNDTFSLLSLGTVVRRRVSQSLRQVPCGSFQQRSVSSSSHSVTSDVAAFCTIKWSSIALFSMTCLLAASDILASLCNAVQFIGIYFRKVDSICVWCPSSSFAFSFVT